MGFLDPEIYQRLTDLDLPHTNLTVTRCLLSAKMFSVKGILLGKKITTFQFNHSVGLELILLELY